VKTPAESKGPWDYYKILATIPGDQAFRSLAEGVCPLVAH
jgi:branched-chain amino acid transport system substrate-binding protein